jgi:hypothetical protein
LPVSGEPYYGRPEFIGLSAMFRRNLIRLQCTSIRWFAISLAAASLVLACKEQPKRDSLPPPAVSTRSGSSAVGAAVAAAPDDGAPVNKAFGMADFRRPACVAENEDKSLTAEHCGSGSVLYGPYTPVPAGGRITATFEVQGLKGTTLMSVDMIGGGGARFFASAGTFELKAGETRTIEIAAEAKVAEQSLEARLWSRAEPDTSFKIANAKLEIHRQ